MFSILISHGISIATKGINQRWPTPMLPLVDKPFIQHVIEFIIDQGGDESAIVLSHLPEEIEKNLGDGSSCGSRFTFHLAKDPSKPYDILKCVSFSHSTGPILLAHADRLPDVDIKSFIPAFSEKGAPVVFRLPGTNDNSGEPLHTCRWSGWALVSPAFLAELPMGLNEQDLESLLFASAQSPVQVVEIPRALDIRTYRGLLDSNRMFLAGQFRNFAPEARELTNGVWIGRNATVHHSAKLSPPVFIGTNSHLGANTKLGPFAVISRNCIVDEESSVRNSVISPNTYIGEKLDLKEVVVDKNWMFNVRIGAEVCVTDSFILGGLTGKHAKHRIEGLASRAIGILLLLILCPLLLVFALCLKLFRRGPVFFTKEVVRLPAPSDEYLWKTLQLISFRPFPDVSQQNTTIGQYAAELFYSFLPSLINVARGELRFVGTSPRSRQEIMNLEEDWKTLYLRSKLGIITEAFVRYGSHPTKEELYSAEAVYSIMGSPSYDMKLIGHYLRRIIFGRHA
jgi:NDP-sugar pyrophosphorylase family protein/lipopolysaccharide/colanic/teichoic acid biosynthesis glycosyltransferase